MKVAVKHGDPRDLTLLEVNARYMRHEMFQQLVANLRRDKVLTSTPLVWLTPEQDRVVLSGNHRVAASIEAGLPEIHWLEVDEELTRDQQLALQLSHNAIVGEDDPEVLASLYAEISDVDLKAYSGLDDATLGLLSEVNLSAIKPPNLQFQTLSLTFLPGEWEEAKQAWAEAERLSGTADEHWIARYEDHLRLLQAIYAASRSHNVKNMGAALAYVLDVFMAHREDLAEGWVGADGNSVKHGSRVPLVTALGSDELPASAALKIRKALTKMQDRGEVAKTDTWRAVEIWAERYLAGD